MDTTQMTRRQALVGASATGAAVLVGFNISRENGTAMLSLGGEEALAAGACTMQTPAKEIGPFFVDEMLNRSNLIDSAADSAQQGIPLSLTMYVFDDDKDCAPLTGAQVDIWHANALGKYSDETSEGTSGKTWMRGYQLADAAGKVAFSTIWPGWYSGRACHIHLRVRTPATATLAAMDFITQLFFPEAQTQLVAATAPYTSNPNSPRVTNAADRVYSSDGASVLVTLSGNTSGYSAEFSAGASRSATNTGGTPGGMPGGGPTGGGTTTTTKTTGTATTATDTAVSVALSKVKLIRGSNGARRVRLTMKPKETVVLSGKLTRSGKRLAKRTAVTLKAGTRTVSIVIPKTVANGPARLKLTVSDSAGNTKSYSRAIHIPTKKS